MRWLDLRATKWYVKVAYLVAGMSDAEGPVGEGGS